MKKTLSILLAVLLIAALLVGCSNDKAKSDAKSDASDKTDSSNKSDESKTDPSGEETEEGIFVLINGQNIKVGVPFADMEDKLGKEAQPAETSDSCDEGSDWKQTMHFYDGMIVTENKDGIIDGLQVSDGDAALMGKIRIGATKDDVKALLGNPDTDESWGIFYENTNPKINLYLDEETGLITGFALMATLEG